jgi:predicted nucleotidyltransferase
MNMLTPKQTEVADRVLDEESGARDHLVVSLSGAHAYGFPSPDSDLDLKAIHIEQTSRLVGLSPPALHGTRLEVIDGVEIDYSSNELGAALVGIVQGNGNYVERVLGALSLRTSPEHEELRPIVQRSLSKRIHRHYQGFARGQLHEFDAAEQPTAKKLLYVLRTTLTGIHVLRTGRVVTDVTLLLDDFGFGEASELVARKRAGERVGLDEPMRVKWRSQVERAFVALDDALANSPLPSESPNRDEVEAWLLAVRRRHWGSQGGA